MNLYKVTNSNPARKLEAVLITKVEDKGKSGASYEFQNGQTQEVSFAFHKAYAPKENESCFVRYDNGSLGVLSLQYITDHCTLLEKE